MSFWQRAPATGGRPLPYAFMTRMSRRNLRPVVIAISCLSALWALLWTISGFKDVGLFSGQSSKLQTLSLVLGILYAVATLIEAFGVVAAVTQRSNLVRMYTYASVLSFLLVAGSGFIVVITHFTLKSDTVKSCINIINSDKDDFNWGLFGGGPGDIDAADVPDWCNDAWSRASWTNIIALLIEIAIGLIFVACNFAYLRQVLDPTSPANSSRAPSNQVRRDLGLGYPDHYNPPYDGYAPPNLGYTPGNSYAPPAGPPPGSETNKPPAYVGEGMSGDMKHGDDPFADFEAEPGYTKAIDGKRTDEFV